MSSSLNIRVCARFRPVNAVEKSQNARVCTEFPQESQVNVFTPGKNKKTFILDHIFRPNSSQETVYEYAGRPLASEILKGYNGTVFAYGQTGSGKTFTMQGDIKSEIHMGLIPRMLSSVFEGIMQADGTEFVVKVSYVEIYREKLKDLLDLENTNLAIRESKANGIYIQGVTSPFVGSYDETMDLMKEGSLSRTCAATRMNESSSRSHSVFIFRLIGTNKARQTKKISKLMMVDLAGSEKTKKTQASGMRLDEAKGINKSLSTLGRVISALSSGKGFAPYRDSKLTRLLSDSLGGNSKTCIIVTCSPVTYNVEETISTLRFGVNCKRVKNKPKVNEELSIAEYKALVVKKNKKEKLLLQKIALLESRVIALKKALTASGGNVEEALQDAGIDSESAIWDDKQQGHELEKFDNSFTEQSKLSLKISPSSSSNYVIDVLRARVNELEESLNHEYEEKERYMDLAADARCELEEIQGRCIDLEWKILKLTGSKERVEKQNKESTIALRYLRMVSSNFENKNKQQQVEIERLKQEVSQLDFKLIQRKTETHDEGMGIKPLPADFLSFCLEEKDLLKSKNPADRNAGNEGNIELIEKNCITPYNRFLELSVIPVNGMRTDLNFDHTWAEPKENDEISRLRTRVKTMKGRIIKLEEQEENLKKTVQKLENRNDVLVRNMERSIMMMNDINNRDQIRFKEELAMKETELARYKLYIHSQKRKARRPGPKNIVIPVGFSRKKKKASVQGNKYQSFPSIKTVFLKGIRNQTSAV